MAFDLVDEGTLAVLRSGRYFILMWIQIHEDLAPHFIHVEIFILKVQKYFRPRKIDKM